MRKSSEGQLSPSASRKALSPSASRGSDPVDAAPPAQRLCMNGGGCSSSSHSGSAAAEQEHPAAAQITMLKVDRSNPSDLVWTGMEGRNGTSVPLDEEWVNANFEPWFLQNVFGAYKHIPGGKASSPKASVLEAGGRGSGRVPVVWQQGANQFCIPYGAAQH